MRKLFLVFLLWGSCLTSIAQVKSGAGHARLQDFAGKLTGGIDRLERKMDEFTGRTGLDIYIITAYKYNQPDISRLAAEWSQQGKGLLLGLNLHEEGNWLQNLQIAYTAEVVNKIPAEKIGQVRDLVLLPLLEGREITVTDVFGGTTKVAFGGQGKHYLTLEQGIDALLAAYAGTPFGSVPTLAFTGSPASRYGFDAKQYDALASRYGQGLNELTGKEAFIPWKALEMGKQDLVALTALGKSSKAELAKIEINAGDGSALPTRVLDDGQLEVTLPGGASEGPEEVEAYYPTSDQDGYVLDRLNLVRYPKVRNKVVVVPLPGAQNVPSPAQLQDSLNRIYGQAVAEWEVTLETTFTLGAWDGNGDGKIETGQSGLLSNYPEEMRAINKVFRNRYNAYEADAYYVFLAGEAENAGTLGYMPRAKQFGYVFTRLQTSAGVARTIAHELGHGAFHLKHTFDETGLARGTSDNLMDYHNGARLHKYQWDLVHDPVRVIGLLEEDEEGALALPCWGLFDDCDDVLKQLAAIKYARERGQPVTVISPPKGAKRVWTASNIKIENTEYEEIRVVCEGPEGSKVAVDPNTYEPYSQTFLTSEGSSDIQEGFVLKNDRGILAKILIFGNYDLLHQKKGALATYLFGECNVVKKLEDIHAASSSGTHTILTFNKGCPRSIMLQNVTINNTLYDNLYCVFATSVKEGESIIIDPKKYQETTNGFEFYLNTNKTYTIHYSRNNQNEGIYETNKAKLEEWLFNSKLNITEEVNTQSNTPITKATEQDYIDYAKNAGIKELNAFKAFTIVESSGKGFFDYNGAKVPVLLYERHLMYKCLRDKKIWRVKATTVDPTIDVEYLVNSNPAVIHPDGYYHCKKCNAKQFPDTYTKRVKNKKNKYFYEDCKEKGQPAQWYEENCYNAMKISEAYERYIEAAKICKECAIMATSWGLGQVIGANFRHKYKSVEEMEKDIFNGSEKFQLFIMSEYIKGSKALKDAINNKDWTTAASIYNGPSYKIGNYDTKLKKEYEALSD